jgi:DNA-binding NarL/FixJ family response regulator
MEGDPDERVSGQSHLTAAIDALRAMRMTPALDRALALRDGGADRGLKPHRPPSPLGLTPREIQVLRLVAAGRSNREIAGALVISENTVIRHVSNIMRKTDAANRAEAAVAASRYGLV